MALVAGNLSRHSHGPHRLDDHTRVETLLPGLNDRVERTTPAAPQEIHRRRRIGTSADRPQDFIGIGDIDIVVNHHDVTPQISTGVALARDQRGLLWRDRDSAA